MHGGDSELTLSIDGDPILRGQARASRLSHRGDELVKVEAQPVRGQPSIRLLIGEPEDDGSEAIGLLLLPGRIVECRVQVARATAERVTGAFLARLPPANDTNEGASLTEIRGAFDAPLAAVGT